VTSSASDIDADSARARLLAAADELFYEQGVQTVGINSIIERAGVAKASLYNIFGSKDELIRAYLRSRHAATVQRTETALAERYSTPRQRLLGVFDVLSATAATPGFHGCAFINASAEARPGGAIEEVANESRAWVRQLFLALATEAGINDPGTLTRQLEYLYDGAGISSWMDADPAAGSFAKDAAATLFDAALTASRRRTGLAG
jgi:AcrR family transcriptional regulator